MDIETLHGTSTLSKVKNSMPKTKSCTGKQNKRKTMIARAATQKDVRSVQQKKVRGWIPDVVAGGAAARDALICANAACYLIDNRQRLFAELCARHQQLEADKENGTLSLA